MTEDDRYNEGQKVRATFTNALAVSTIVVGGFTALRDGDWLIALGALLLGLILHDGAMQATRSMRTEND